MSEKLQILGDQASNEKCFDNINSNQVSLLFLQSLKGKNHKTTEVTLCDNNL